MKYLSRLTLQLNSADLSALAGLVFRDRYREHQEVWRFFDDDPDATRDFLFRRESRRGVLTYYVLSDRQPADRDRLWRVETKPLQPRLRPGQRLRFAVRVNPVVTRHDENGRHKRHDVVMDRKRQIGYSSLPFEERPPMHVIVRDACLNWLQSRSEKSGFAITDDKFMADGYLQHSTRRNKRSSGSITFSTVDLSGILTVTDPQRIQGPLFHGLGPGKGFGCGLLMVAPA